MKKFTTCFFCLFFIFFVSLQITYSQQPKPANSLQLKSGSQAPCNYTINITKSITQPTCYESNKVCFSTTPRYSAYFFLWDFDDPQSGLDNNNDDQWNPCHVYTSPGIYNVSLKITEPGCTRDTIMCEFVKIKGPKAMIKIPPPYRNNRALKGKFIPASVFNAANTSCWNPNNDSIVYAVPTSVVKYVSRIDSYYCNAPIKSIVNVTKNNCDTNRVISIQYNLTNAQGTTLKYDSVRWTKYTWHPGDAYPTIRYYPPDTNYFDKNIHDSDQYIYSCKGPNLVFFPNNSMKYRLRYDIDNNASNYSIPPKPDMSMDKCKNPSYPWASDSMNYFWDFGDPYALGCTSTVASPNTNCNHSTERTPYHLYSKSGCYIAQLKVTDNQMNCTSTNSISIVMDKPAAGWDKNIFKQMQQNGWDTSSRRLDWNSQQVIPPTWGRRGMVLVGTPCVGQMYPQRPTFNETIPRCDRQQWWMVFDSAANCSGYCSSNLWVDTNGDAVNDILIKNQKINCNWIDDITFSMMGNKWIYNTGGCKTLGLIIRTGDCYDTFWYSKYKYINDLNPEFKIMDPSSYNTNTGKYDNSFDLYSNDLRRLCAPFNVLVAVKDTHQVGIDKFTYNLSQDYAAPWVIKWTSPISDTIFKIKSYSYQICNVDSFSIDPFSGDTLYTNCFLYPYQHFNCDASPLANQNLTYLLNNGYKITKKYANLDLKDTLFLKDQNNICITDPGIYSVSSMIHNQYGCYNFSNTSLYVGHYTDIILPGTNNCSTGKDTVKIWGNIGYFNYRMFQWDPLVNPTNFWRNPVSARFGYVPAKPEKVEWDLNGDGIYTDGTKINGYADSIYYIYNKPGVYDISMRTTDSNGYMQVLTKKNFIRIPAIVADFDKAISSSICAPQTVDFSDKSQGIAMYQYIFDNQGNVIDSNLIDTIVWWQWNFGDGSSSNLKNPLHTYTTNGCYDVTLMVRTLGGCEDTLKMKSFVCIQGPVADFSLLDTAGCEPITVFVKDRSSNLKIWEFVKGDNTTSSFKSRPSDSMFALVYSIPGNYDLYLKVMDSIYESSTGKWIKCTVSYGEPSDPNDPHFKVHVYAKPAKPTITVTKDTLLTCSAADAYQWYKNGIIIAGATKQTYVTKQHANFKVEVTNTYGCKNMSDSVIVLSIADIDDMLKFELMPNPFNKSFVLKAIVYQQSKISVRITNTHGQLVYKENITAKGPIEKKFEIAGMKPGLYYFTIKIKDKEGTIQLIKE